MHGALAAQAVKSKRDKKEEHERKKLFRKPTNNSLNSEKTPRDKVPDSALTFLNVGIIFTIIGGVLLFCAYFIPNSMDELQSFGIICFCVGIALLILNLCFYVIFKLYMRARREIERTERSFNNLEEGAEGGEGEELDDGEESNTNQMESMIDLEKIAEKVDVQSTQRL